MDGYMRRVFSLLCPADRELVSSIIGRHRDKVALCVTIADARAKTKAFLKPLQTRNRGRLSVGDLSVPSADGEAGTFHQWLAGRPEEERMRNMAAGGRISEGVSQWPLEWLTEPGVICYERAAGRIRDERGGVPDADFMRGVIKMKELPTAVASPSGHYVLVLPGGANPRYLTVEEVARGFQVPTGSPLMRMLSNTKELTTIQLTSCLGRGVHVGVARRLVSMLVLRGKLSRGMTYGSAYSGIDTFAAAVEAEFSGDFSYEFASECNESVRSALLEAWGERGLTAGRCDVSAFSEASVGRPQVDLWVITPTCKAYSKRNHDRNATEQNATLSEVWEALRYVQMNRPRVVVMENVCEVSAVGPLTGLLSRLSGYSMEAGSLDPREVAKAPMARERHFWVLTRDKCAL